MKRNGAAASLIVAVFVLAGTAACSSSTGAAGSATATGAVASPSTLPSAAASAAASATYSGQPWVLPSPSTSDEAKAIWCSALTQVIARTVPGTETDGELRKRIDALATYKQLWETAAQRGYVTAQEAEVNRIYLDGYIQMAELKLARVSANSPEMGKVITGMNALTSDSKALFDSSAAKITEFCQLSYGSARPTPTASPSGS